MKTTGNLGLKKPEGTDIVDITDLNSNMDILDSTVNGKVDKVTGKQLSTNDYTTAEKTKLTGIATGANNYTHPNHTGDVTSTGDGVTAITAGVIVDADVNAAAGIAWTKLNKTGASLADLATRSAGDLTSGTLLAARLPAITGDITMAAGTGTAAITAGAVVNADVNVAAAIDATKLGTGVVSNTEFGYLDGVTSGIQAQLNARPLLTTTPQQTTAALTYYVRTDGNDSNTGLVNTAGGAFRTIAKAVSVLPMVINHVVTINVAAGTYAEIMTFKGFSGGGTIAVVGDNVISTSRSINSIALKGNSLLLSIDGFNCLTPGNTDAISITSCIGPVLNAINSTVASTGCGAGINLSNARITGCNFSNKADALLLVNASIAYLENSTGTGNIRKFRVVLGSYAAVAGTEPLGVDYCDTGSTINRAGVINPWGDNTTSARSYVDAVQINNQTLIANTFTKVAFGGTRSDNLGEYTAATNRFTAKKVGLYLITAGVSLATAVPVNTTLTLSIFCGGGRARDIGSYSSTASTNTIQTQGAAVIFLPVNTQVEIYAYASSSGNTTLLGNPDGVLNHFTVVQVG